MLSRRYAKSRFEEDRTRTEIGRNSSGFAAEQMTIDSEDSFQVDNGSPPIPSSPTGVPGTPTCDDESSPTKSKQHFTFPTVNEIDEPTESIKRYVQSHIILYKYNITNYAITIRVILNIDEKKAPFSE